MERCNFLTESFGALAGEALPRITAAQSVSANQATSSGLASLKTADVDVAGNKIFYRRYGQGPTILLVHGFPRTSLMWRLLAAKLAADHNRGMRRSAWLRTKLDTSRPLPAIRAGWQRRDGHLPSRRGTTVS